MGDNAGTDKLCAGGTIHFLKGFSYSNHTVKANVLL